VTLPSYLWMIQIAAGPLTPVSQVGIYADGGLDVFHSPAVANNLPRWRRSRSSDMIYINNGGQHTYVGTHTMRRYDAAG